MRRLEYSITDTDLRRVIYKPSPRVRRALKDLAVDRMSKLALGERPRNRAEKLFARISDSVVLNVDGPLSMSMPGKVAYAWRQRYEPMRAYSVDYTLYTKADPHDSDQIMSEKEVLYKHTGTYTPLGLPRYQQPSEVAELGDDAPFYVIDTHNPCWFEPLRPDIVYMNSSGLRPEGNGQEVVLLSNDAVAGMLGQIGTERADLDLMLCRRFTVLAGYPAEAERLPSSELSAAERVMRTIGAPRAEALAVYLRRNSIA